MLQHIFPVGRICTTSCKSCTTSHNERQAGEEPLIDDIVLVIWGVCKPFGASVSRRNNNAWSIRISFCFFTDSRHTFLRFFRLFFDIKKKKRARYTYVYKGHISPAAYIWYLLRQISTFYYRTPTRKTSTGLRFTEKTRNSGVILFYLQKEKHRFHGQYVPQNIYRYFGGGVISVSKFRTPTKKTSAGGEKEIRKT